MVLIESLAGSATDDLAPVIDSVGAARTPGYECAQVAFRYAIPEHSVNLVPATCHAHDLAPVAESSRHEPQPHRTMRQRWRVPVLPEKRPVNAIQPERAAGCQALIVDAGHGDVAGGRAEGGR